MSRRMTFLAAVGLVASLAACGGSPQTSTPTAQVTPTSEVTPTPEATPAPTLDPSGTVDPTADVAPFHAIPAGSVFVSGNARCTFPEVSEGFLALCTLDMSDPRVSGSERQAGWQVLAENGQPQGTVWVANELSLTNAEGTWRGSAQATDVDNTGTLLEAHYIGEGAYEGLEFHYYLSDVSASDVPNAPVVQGWISGGE